MTPFPAGAEQKSHHPRKGRVAGMDRNETGEVMDRQDKQQPDVRSELEYVREFLQHERQHVPPSRRSWCDAAIGKVDGLLSRPQEQAAQPAPVDHSRVVTPKGRVVELWNSVGAPDCPGCWARLGEQAFYITADGVVSKWGRPIFKTDVPNQCPLPANAAANLDALIDSLEKPAVPPAGDKPLWVDGQRFKRSDGTEAGYLWYIKENLVLYDYTPEKLIGSRSGVFPSIEKLEAAIKSGELIPADPPAPITPVAPSQESGGERGIEPWTFETVPVLTMKVRTKRTGNPKVATFRPGKVVGYGDDGIQFRCGYKEFSERYEQLDGSPCGVVASRPASGEGKGK